MSPREHRVGPHTALIGYTGFVGSTLLRQHSFVDLYRSNNIDDIRGQAYDLVVCAGAPAAKWRANAEPDADRDNLRRLMDCLDHCTARRVVLISTVDVYPSPRQVDESSAIDINQCQPYGKHRYELECFVAGRFQRHHIVRLPALVGRGLRKNFIYDLLNRNCLDWTDHRSSFQFYDMRNLWRDCEWCIEAGLSLVNLAVEPLTAAEIAWHGFGITFDMETPKPPVSYDMHSQYADLFGGRGPYMYSAVESLAGIQSFVSQERKAA